MGKAMAPQRADAWARLWWAERWMGKEKASPWAESLAASWRGKARASPWVQTMASGRASAKGKASGPSMVRWWERMRVLEWAFLMASRWARLWACLKESSKGKKMALVMEGSLVTL